MDSYETLRAARTIKERGNDCFKRGQLFEAQRDYTEVLAMLTEEITFTGDDQRKEKETLVLTAHLNLAQCALRLGDSARVIYHCNTALNMDSNNVKAHFRKARAFENRAEFAEALEGYRHVLILEPNNEIMLRQLSECQKKLDNQKAEEQMSNKMTGQEDQEEDEDVEVVYEDSERDPQTRYKNCTKNPGHHKFINVNEFKIEDFPPAYRDQELFDHIKHQSQITVMLQVWPARKSRLRCSPGTGRSNRENRGPGNRIRPLKHGSGWLCLVDLHTEDEQHCPCLTCTISESPERRWAEIFIWTAAHVVRNDKEANNTECYFFYDTKELDLYSCPTLSRAAIDSISTHADFCGLKFISHDEAFSCQLDKICKSYRDSLLILHRKYIGPDLLETDGSLLEQCEQLWQLYTELMADYDHLLERMVAILNGDPHIELVKHRKRRKENTEFDELGQLLKDKIREGVRYQEIIEDLQLEHEGYCELLEGIPEDAILLRQNPNSERDLIMNVSLWQQNVKFVEMRVMRLRNWLGEDVPLPQAEFNEDHRLTVIVSHPHGCSKKVTIGETTERTTEYLGLFSQLIYTTPTCPGSSGARVFVLGQRTVAIGHPHSAAKSGRSLRQLNESAVSYTL